MQHLGEGLSWDEDARILMVQISFGQAQEFHWYVLSFVKRLSGLSLFRSDHP